MGVTSRRRSTRPPLPAPTDSMDEGGTSGIDTDVATNITDKSTYELPADGSPITISTQAIASKKEGANGALARAKSQTSTSLLIEYFEASSTGDRAKSKPTVRVKVSQNPKKRSASGAHDAVQITGIGEDRKPSYTRRISLGSGKRAEEALTNTDSAEVYSSESTSSNRPPVEIEVLDHNGSDLSTRSRGLAYNPVESNVSSMPPDSMLEGDQGKQSEQPRSFDQDDDITVKDGNYLREPDKGRSRSRSTERIAQKVMEKLNRPPSAPLKTGKSRSERSLAKQYDVARYSQGSDVSNNPRLLGLVQDTIKNYILPEIQAAKEDQRSGRTPRSSESSRRGSIRDDGLVHRISKSSSTPNISSKPKVVLNRDGNDPGTTLSRGDSERKLRKSSGGSYKDEREKASRSSTSLRDAGAASIGAGILTTENLEKHDSRGDGYERRRKHRSKSRGSRSRSTGVTETGDAKYTSKNDIPPLPLAGDIDDSELTRDSLVSEKGHSRTSAETRTPVREVSRGSLRKQREPPSETSRTPTRTPLNRNLGMSRENISIENPKSAEGGTSTKERMVALAATGVTGAALAKGTEEMYRHHVDADGYGETSSGMRKLSSPVQSVSSLRKNFEDDTMATNDSRPRSATSRSSAGRLREKRASQTSLPSGTPSPFRQSARRSPNTLPGAQASARSPATPTEGENLDDFYEQQHRLNDEYRQSYMSDSPNRDSFRATNRDSYQTNPYPQDEKRWTMFTDDSPIEQTTGTSGDKDLQNISSNNPEYVHTPHGAESAVASLMEPSSISSGSPTKASYSDRMSAHLREMGIDSPPMYQGSTLSQTVPSQDRWTAIKRQAQSASGSTPKLGARSMDSPRQSPARSPDRSMDTKAVVGASGLPIADDPLPEIGHYDDSKSDDSANRSIVKGPLGGDVTGKSTWPYTPEPASPADRAGSSRDSRSLRSGSSKEDAMLAASAARSAAIAAGYATRKATVEDDPEDRRLASSVRESKSASPVPSRNRDYVADTPTRSAGSLTPEAEQKQYSKADVDEFNRVMDAQVVDERHDPFTTDVKRARHISANSHGMASPIYDSSTGKGKDHIQSKDIVALMDHLTVRDAQRNARDTEIIVTLVRSAAEMRQSFDEMKRFILEQDRMIMENTDRSADSTAQKVLGGPRPLPARSSGYIGTQSQEDIQTKRRGVLRRALRGLTGTKSSNDLGKVENMLMQILENVEDLKHQNGGGSGPRDTPDSRMNDSLDEYERMRNAPEPGYDVQSPSNASSTPRQSAQNLAFTPRAEKYQFHSGYDGRRGSMNRVSTVMEGDEDDELDEHDPYLADIPVDGGERLLTPTQEAYRERGISPEVTPSQGPLAYNNMQDDLTPRSIDRQRKHQSDNSPMFGGAKVSRWSKTTSSSAAPDPAYDSPQGARNANAPTEASRSGSTLARYQDEGYELKDDDRLRSTQSLAREQQEEAGRRSIRSQASKVSRTPSPLIPSEASSARQRDAYEYARGTSPVQEDLDPEFDDPKYQAVRNSLLLQHPQPRQGTTGRHQNTLESQAHDFDDMTGTNSDLSQKTVSDFDPAMWGSSGTAGLAKHRLSQFEPLSPVSMGSPAGYAGNRSSAANEAPLVPQQQQKAPPIPPKIRQDEADYETEWEPQRSNSGFSRGGYYSSPFGSGHLLEPIEEVRYSLETDSGHISPEPEIASAQAVNMRSSARKITGPRPMRVRNTSAEQPRLVETSGTVRRKALSSY